EQLVALDGQTDQFEGTAGDDRDNSGTNAVEGALHPRQAAVLQINRCQSKDHDERRQNERDADQRRPEKPRAYPAEVHGQLGRQWTGRELREGKTLNVILLAYPAARLDEVALHVSREGDRPAEAKRPQAQKVQKQLPQGAGLDRYDLFSPVRGRR